MDDLESDQLGKNVTRYYQLLLQRVGGYGSVRRLIIVHPNGNEREWTAFEDQAVAQEQLRLPPHRMSPLERSVAMRTFSESIRTIRAARQPETLCIRSIDPGNPW
ncbi:hypothetical protein DPV78_000667 [Talaromyces pinophilus]|nr:hypothetical protein DPV78_000667 [Talaromyces pinophilus]